MADFDYKTLDKSGKPADMSLLGRKYQHSGNGKVYVIKGLAWNGETDLWNVAMHSGIFGEPAVVRPVDHLEGNRDNGEKRYVEVF